VYMYMTDCAARCHRKSTWLHPSIHRCRLNNERRTHSTAPSSEERNPIGEGARLKMLLCGRSTSSVTDSGARFWLPEVTVLLRASCQDHSGGHIGNVAGPVWRWLVFWAL